MRFDFWELDTGRRALLRSGERVHVSPKAYQLLYILLTHAPNAVSKNDLHEKIWPDTFVAESNLAVLIAELRAVLGDDARRPRYVRTLHRFGYAFVADVESAEAVDAAAGVTKPSRFRVGLGGRDIALAVGTHVIGRNPESSIVIDHLSVSREHARIVIGDSVTLEDLRSKNGTFVNGTPVSSPAPLRNRDVITVGSVTLTFHDTAAAESTVTMLGHDRD